MKIARLYSFEDIRIEDVPVPEIGDYDALVSVRACGICSGDVMPWYVEKKSPLVLGHEPAGEIVKVGSRVKGFKPGQRVFFHHHAPCFNCRYCKRGDYVQCNTWRESCITPGGISEYALVPETNLKGDTLILPDNVSFEDATLIEPIACVIKGLKRANLRKGETVLVMGLGIMGQLNVILAKIYGAGRVIAADTVPYRIKCAKGFGADAVIDVSKTNIEHAVRDITNREMADIVVVGPGSVEAMAQGLECADRGGRVIFFTPARPDDTLKLQPNEIYFKDINIITSYSCGPDNTKEALKLISERKIDTNRLITHKFPMDKTADAFNLTAKAKSSLKVIVVM